MNYFLFFIFSCDCANFTSLSNWYNGWQADGSFRCKNNVIIGDWQYICDGLNDCGDNSDETTPFCQLSNNQ